MQKIIPKKIADEGEVINFLHSANIGDLIYTLPAVRAICKDTGAKARIMCGLDQPATYEMGPHPLGNVMFSRNSYAMARPLLMDQPYIYDVEIWEGEREVHFNIDQMRDDTRGLGMPHTEIRQWCMMKFPELAFGAEIATPWLERPVEAGGPYLVINITQRYRTQNPDYSFLEDCGVPVIFLGTLDEYNLFIKQCRTAKYMKTKDYAEVAKVIAGSKLFIGNQSSCFAVAEGLGHPRLLEICHVATNVTPCTPGGTPFVYKEALEYLVKRHLSA